MLTPAFWSLTQQEHTMRTLTARPLQTVREAGRISTVLIVVLAIVVLIAAAVLLVASRIPDDASLAQRLAARLEKALGVPVSVGSVHWQLLPHPQVTIADVVAAPTREQVSEAITRRAAEARQKSGKAPGPAANGGVPVVPPDTSELTARIGQITLHPQLWPLLHHEIAFDRVTVQGARLPQLLLTAFGGRPDKSGASDVMAAGDGTTGNRWHLASLPLARFEFRDIEWVGRHDKALPYAGAVDFDAGWRPRHAEVVRTDAEPKAQLVLERQSGQDRWAVTIAIAGGSLDGTLTLQAPMAAGVASPAANVSTGDSGTPDAESANKAKETWQLRGDFVPKNLDMLQLLGTFDRKSVVSGKLNGSVHLQSAAASAGGLLSALITQTQFRIAPATILHFDLDKAIHTLGQRHDGSTPLDLLEGRLETNSSPRGMVLHYTDLHATAGKLSARGEATLQDRQIDARFAVDLVDGLIGVPLHVTGPVSSPSYTVPASALAGAVAGSAVLPGIGTAIGARIGGLIDRVFGDGDNMKSSSGAKSPIGPTPPPTTRP